MSKRIDSGGRGDRYADAKPDNVIKYEFGSLDEYAEFILRPEQAICTACWSPSFQGVTGGGYGGVYDTEEVDGKMMTGGWANLIEMTRNGWREPVAEAMDVAERAVKWVEQEVESFEPVHAVSGADVDVATYLSGAPENMVEYPPQRVSNLGTLITMCADVQSWNTVSAENIKKRGYIVASLAIALDKLGHQTELWISDEYQVAHRGPVGGFDSSNMWRTANAPRQTHRVIVRVKVKSANDWIDPARIMFAFAHPGVQRGLGFTLAQNVGGSMNESRTTLGHTLHNAGFGNLTRITRDMPEGTIYLPPITNNADAPNADRELRMYLAQIGLVENTEED